MTLGERLRKARLDAGLSQRQLCGEEITRNMLSQIEHGTACPSMSTLQFLAHRLHLPVSYFLEEEAAVSANQSCMDSAWERFQSGDSGGALAELERYQEPDPIYDREKKILLALVLLAFAEKNMSEGRLLYAQKLLNQEESLEAGLPWLPELRCRRMLLLGRMGASVPLEELPNLEEWLLLQSQAAMSAGNGDRAIGLLGACRERNARWCLLRGRAAMMQSDFGCAVKNLQSAEADYPQQAIPLLERAFRELGDYRSAYEYACKARENP